MSPPIAPEEFIRVRQLYGSQKQAADACGVGVKQLRRWESGLSPVPRAPYRLLAILGGRDLGEIEPAWRGWLLRGDALGTPEGEVIRRTLYMEMPYLINAARARELGSMDRLRRLMRLARALLGRLRCRRSFPVQHALPLTLPDVSISRMDLSAKLWQDHISRGREGAYDPNTLSGLRARTCPRRVRRRDLLSLSGEA
ncbi:MAG: hypothetical protein AB7I42_25835 [Bradyrhizobium sp.]|uniref:hypothetical protein n=1 Tax=Bradyrhizobium sp. TaxID=376 RepID=UPI003D13A58E